MMNSTKTSHSQTATRFMPSKLEELIKKGRPTLQPMTPDMKSMRDRPHTVTTMKNLSKSTPIEIIPSEIIINDIEPNQTYEVVVQARNLTSTGRRIRVYQPKTNKFRCDYDMQGNIAPGLSMKLLVSFETDKYGDFHDSIKIVSEEKFSAVIPLHAYQTQATIQFEPFINFGFIQTQKEEVRVISFKNEGRKEGKVDLKFSNPNSSIAISPNSFVIHAGEKINVKLSYKAKDAGIFRDVIQVNVGGQTLNRHIDVSATSVDYYIFLIDPQGAQSSSFDFGDIYFGQSKEIEAYLVNNSPQRFNFKAKFVSGIQSNNNDMQSLQTPNELGQEQVQRVMTCIPEDGIVDSYSQIPIKFHCQSRVNEEMTFWTRNYCMKRGRGDKFDMDEHFETRFDPKLYGYTCVFEFNGQTDISPYVHLSAKGICPTIKISHHLINFGECKVNERRDFVATLENRNEDLAVDLSFSNVAHFKVHPKKIRLAPRGSESIVLTFEPKSMGKFTSYVDLAIFGAYKIPLKLIGSSLSIGEKKHMKKGSESLPEDFKIEKNFVTEENVEQGVKKIKKGDRIIFTHADASENINIPQLEGTDLSEKMDLYHAQKNNKTKYNNFLKEQRLKRLESRQGKKPGEKDDLTAEQLEKLLPNKDYWLGKDKEDDKLHHPFDYNFILGKDTIPLDQPKYSLPNPNAPLFVTKPIGQYEPELTEKMDTFKPDPNKPFKIIFPSEPKTQAEMMDTTRELTADELQRVFAGPTSINFGSVYVKSKASRYFSIQNQLRTSIMARIECSDFELMESRTIPQIIPTAQTAGFELVLYSEALKNFKGYVKYIINGKHEFRFNVLANVEPVKLQLDQNQMVFRFQDKDEEMEMTSFVKISNKGNAKGVFNWKPVSFGIFKVNPAQGEVPAEGSTTVAVTYIPSGTNFKGESERLTMTVQDGDSQFLTCVGHANESKCEFKDPTIDFEQVLVNTEQSRSVYLKNKHKTTGVFQISRKLPYGINVTPHKGRIPPDGHQELKVTFGYHEALLCSGEIIANIRGGKPAKIMVRGETIVPQVRIVQDEFDFGGITFGSVGVLPLTLINDSNIAAVLDIDLREGDAQYLQIVSAEEHGDDESSLVKSFNSDNSKIEDFETKDISEASDDSDDDEEEKEETRKFSIKSKRKSALNLLLKFKPEDARNYSFELPLVIRGYGKIEGTTRVVTCRGIKPRCIIQPNVLDFKKKVITNFEKPMPVENDIEVDNMDYHRPLIWNLDLKQLGEDEVFTVSPSKGRIEPGQRQIIRVGFNPFNPGNYEKKIPFYIDNDQSNSYADIILKGQGDFPRLLFERREIIIPVVPLDIESRCVFKIINDGYENLTLKYEVFSDIGKLPIRLEFPEGRTLGVTKPKLKVEAIFSSPKPISLTSEIHFFDDSKHVYKVRVSATADNSLLTNFPYIQRSAGDFEIVAEPGKPILLREHDIDQSETSRRAISVGVSKSGSVAKTARSLLGYSPIPFRELERACDGIRNWLNQHVLATYISKFPHEVLENNGAQFFELITYLTGKAPGRAALEKVTKKNERIQLLYKQYDDLIRSLKENGALLNNIRPEYLLKHYEYNIYVKINPSANVMQSNAKLSEGKFAYLSNDAWITLFYQVLKIYYLSRLNQKSFRSTGGFSAEKLALNDNFLEGSNFLSINENLLLKWLELHYEKINPGRPRTITNFDSDLKDGQVFAAVIQSYVGVNACKALNTMKMNPVAKEEFIHNAERVITALEDIGLATQLTPKDIEIPRQREMVIFCLYLYNNLPHYIPKDTIEFKCTLRDEVIKHIVLSNPSAKPINYRVHLDADADFSLEGTEERDSNVHVDPKSKVEFPVKFSARLSKPTTGRIFFTNKREEGSTQAAALVFNLVSKVIGRRSEVIEQFESKLYEMRSREIKVENIFPAKGDFIVELVHQKNQPEGEEDSKAKRKKLPAKIRSPRDPLNKAEEKIDTHIAPFSTKVSTLSINKGNSSSLSVQFLPFTLETHTCYLIFRDDKVGEMQYTLQGKADLPTPIELPPPSTFYLESPMHFSVPISLQNTSLMNARRINIERLPQVLKAKEQEKEKYLKQQEKAMETITFDIESLSPYLTPPPFTVLVNPNATKKPVVKDGSPPDKKGVKKIDASLDSRDTGLVGSMVNLAKTDNRIGITLNFKTPTKDHPLRFLLKSQNQQDIRLYEFKATVLPKPMKALLEMRCPARETLVQDIPVRNDTDKDWSIRAQLIPDNVKNGQCFSSPKDFRVPKNSTGTYQIIFKPHWILEAEARLILNNPSTGQQYEFDLRGVGEEPLAETHVILECKARQTKACTFTLKNDSEKKVTYRVETDLYNASGKSTFEVLPNRSEDYALEVTPVLGGAYTGSITFFDDEGRYKWWTVEVHTESPKAEKAIDLSTIIRKALAFEIAISNPLDEKVIFEVILHGDGLLGENAFVILPKQTATYELVFSPLKVGKQLGSIAFIHEKLGEVWYDLNLEAIEPAPVRLSTLRAELGKVESHEVELENPTNKEVRVKYRITNAHNFDILPEEIIIAPYDAVLVQIRYMPSDLDVLETCEIFFETEEIGNWIFLAFGQGVPPTKFEAQVVAGALNRDVSTIINFKNPFKEPITVVIDLIGNDDSQQVFKLLLKKTKATINGLSHLQIPVSFLPRNINDYYAEVVVAMNEKIKWKYPLKGVTESYSNSSDFYIRTKCRVKQESDLHITLPGNPGISPEDVYSLELANIPKEYDKILNNTVHKALIFTPIRNNLDDPNESLVFKATFQPLKPFKTVVELIIIKSTGGRWKFKLHLEASYPEPDDNILITSVINKTSSVSFKLNNYNKYNAEFIAGFTPDSDSEFSVTPKAGILEAHKTEREGTAFIISFTPLEYGKIKIAKLIIQTDEMFWSFNIKGTFPKYFAPKIQATRIENKLPSEVVKRLTQKHSRNFLVENIRNSSHSPPKRGKQRSRSNSRSQSPEGGTFEGQNETQGRRKATGYNATSSYKDVK